MKIFTITLFVVMAIAQWFVPLAMISEKENAYKQGTAFKFKTQPIDPTDPFRGKYITLLYELSRVKTTKTGWEGVTSAYVIVERDSAGFAAISSVTQNKPDEGNYFVATVDGYYTDHLELTFPFERFYLEESKASSAESVYNDANTPDSSVLSYAVVYIKDGETYLHDVIIGDESIVEIVRKANDANWYDGHERRHGIRK
jgi:uncharacterized membrane-anchored protein